MTEYYVNHAGDDSNGGLSSGDAWLTIGKALTVATAGDRVNILADEDYVITSQLDFTNGGSVAGGALTVEGYTTTIGDKGGRPTITCATNGVAIFRTNGTKRDIVFRHLRLEHTASTRGDGIVALGGVASKVTVDDCVIDGCADGIEGEWAANFRFDDLVLRDTEIANCTGVGLNNSGNTSCLNCHIHDNTVGIATGHYALGLKNLRIERCRVESNGIGITIDVSTVESVTLTLVKCDVSLNTGDGIHSSLAATKSFNLCLENNIIYNNGGYGVNLTAAPDYVLNRNNAYGSNTSGARNNLTSGTNDVTLTADPYTDGAGGDFTLNSTAGGGAACRAAGSPANVDIGSFQHTAATPTTPVLDLGGMRGGFA